MRKLASIQRITDIQPIPGADAIEVATVLGWRVVVKKGEFSVGDLAVYMEIDSVPPDEEPYRFLWAKYAERPATYRIRTVKLRGQVSQGILFPLSAFAEAEWADYAPREEGYDITDLLGITKYESPLPAGANDIVGAFLSDVPKTDEERVQSETGEFHRRALLGRPYYITEKADGSSVTIGEVDGEVGLFGRNYRLATTNDNSYVRAFNAFNYASLVKENQHLAIQGELVGPGVQKNGLGLKDNRILIFNIFDRQAYRYLGWFEMRDLCIAYDLPTVKFVEGGTSFNYTADELLELAEGKYHGTTNEREGVVIRSNDDGDRVSFKAVSNRFLLKGGD